MNFLEHYGNVAKACNLGPTHNRAEMALANGRLPLLRAPTVSKFFQRLQYDVGPRSSDSNICQRSHSARIILRPPQRHKGIKSGTNSRSGELAG